MKNNIFLNKENFFIVFLFLFSLLINQYYGNKGIFPVDSFAHFDTGFRVLIGEYPFKDYWVISGPFLDYFQAIFFYFFGVNWQSYVLHASVLNGILSATTFMVLRNFKLNIYYSLIYSFLFSILAYTSSGTPFVDHHSAFLSLLGIYSLILGIRTEKKIFWILLPIFFIFAFLSKQVPASYIIISTITVLSIFSIFLNKYYWIKYSFLSSFFLVLLLLALGKIQGITLTSFIDQYLFYPQSIAAQRFDNFIFTFRGTIGNYKFIYIALIPLFFINLKKIFFQKDYFKYEDFYYFLILILLTFSLIFHQIFTRNQIFIFFLIPILFAFSHIFMNSNKSYLNNYIHIILILICLFATFKYHKRFNENRKFHELNYVNFELAVNAKKIDKKFNGLRWISQKFDNNPNEEINLINEIKIHLKNDNRNIMVMTNYSFFSAILEKSFFSTTRWHIFDGTDYPQKHNRYFTKYKNLLIKSIKRNNIKAIYTVDPVKNSNIYDYVNKNCFEEKKITKILRIYELKKCEEING